MKENLDPQRDDLLERMVHPDNMKAAWKQVARNKGAAGVDGRDIAETKKSLREHWPTLRKQLLDETYHPYPVLRVEIPKPGGGIRKLGIPTVTDRLIQQALTQVLTPLFDPGFSESSYGFRQGRSAHDAVRQALEHQEEGKQWVVDLDLKQFFDEVNHDVLMARIGRKVNREKSAVARPWKRSFLGFTFIKVHGKMRIHIPESSLDTFRYKVKVLLHKGRGRNVSRFIREGLNPFLRGWLNYFRPGVSKRILRQLDFWIRRRMRCLIWRQWKRPATRVRKLLSLGCSEEQSRSGWNRRGPWPCAGMPAMKQTLDPDYFGKLGLFGLLANMVCM